MATQTGIEILKRGGSAVDAAVAMNACLGFLEPTSSGIGGDCFAMLWDPKQGKVVGLAAVSTPGACDAWWTLHQRYGRLKWADLFAPAIHMKSSPPVSVKGRLCS